jgi:tRNA(Ile2) C34 agmatinyltransferase TiaS
MKPSEYLVSKGWVEKSGRWNHTALAGVWDDVSLVDALRIQRATDQDEQDSAPECPLCGRAMKIMPFGYYYFCRRCYRLFPTGKKAGQE